MQSEQKKVGRVSASLTGAAGEYFVAGELSRLGYISLPTIKNTKGADIIASTKDFKETVFLQIKTNRNKYDFWIVGNPVQGDKIFYVFVNLLSQENNKRPEYYIVPSRDVYAKFKLFESAKKHVSLTTSEKKEVIDRIKTGKTAWTIVADLGISVRAIRRTAKENNLKIKYDRGKGENFPFCFYIRKDYELKYLDKWDMMFNIG